MSDGALVHISGDRFLARKKIFSFLGAKFHIFDPEMNLVFFVQQKAFKLKEAITVYRDEAKTTPVLTIQARSRLDFGATYDVADASSGEKVGALRRKGLKSILQDEWHILDTGDNQIGMIKEDSMALALVRRFLSNLVPQSFTVTMGSEEVAEFRQNFNPFVAKYDIDFTPDKQNLLDRRLGIAAVILLLAIEGKQG